MKNNKIMHSLWNKSLESISTRDFEGEISDYDKLATSIFCPGPHYYYVIDFFDRQLTQVSSSIESLLGLDPLRVSFDDILNSIHPDDIAYVAKAEEKAINYFYTILGRENIPNYKVCYCFRSKVADGSYQLFQHQAIVLSVDEKGGIGKSLNIHTSIHHITKVNNHRVHIIGIHNETEIIELDVNDGCEEQNYSSFFSKRESQIINLITLGFKNDEIADKLFISVFTVKNHHKNILQKAGVKSSAELIGKCINEGLI